MTSIDPACDGFAFGRFCCLPRTHELLEDGLVVELGGRAFEILVYLIENTGRTVSKADLFRAVWPGRTVEDNNLTVQMSAIRRALGGAEQAKLHLLTVPGVGYRFIGPVKRVPSSDYARTGPTEAAQVVASPANRLSNLPVFTTSFVGRGSVFTPESSSPTPTTAQPAPATPAPSASFIGRVDEMAEIRRRLKQSRLVTITGTGGIGKTRIARQLAADLGSEYRDGAWFVDLVATADADRVGDTVAAALQIGGGERPAPERLAAFLRDRSLLLILDNCEHVVDAAAALVTTLIAACPSLTILATSRESLFIGGESIYRLPPLPVPARAEGIDSATALAHDAVRLFVERAKARVEGFVLDDNAAPAVAQICIRLDGIALAIEMAVSRLKVLSPTQLAERLNDRFHLLAAPERAASPRHRTLRAMIDWSYDLLSEDERSLLRRLSIFAGGADLAAVLAVAAPAKAADWEILDALASLADKSLIVAETIGATRRFRLLESIRQYAREKLAETGEAECRRRHAEHFARVFEAAEAEWPRTPMPLWLERHSLDMDNMRSALDWTFGSSGNVALGLRLVAASYPLWWDLPDFPIAEGRRWYAAAIPLITAETPVAVAARLWLGAAWRDFRLNDAEDLANARRALALFRREENPQGVGAALWRVSSNLLNGKDDAEALEHALEAARLLRPLGPSKWLVFSLIRVAAIRQTQREFDIALTWYEEAMAMARSLEDWYGRMFCTNGLSELLFELGQRDHAIALLSELRADLLPRRRPQSLAPLVSHLLMAKRMPEMLDTATEMISLSSMLGLTGPLGWVSEALALVLAQSGEIERAARFAGFARRVHPAVHMRIGARRAVLKALEELLEGSLPQAKCISLAQEGASWSDDYMASEAMRFCATVSRNPLSTPHSASGPAS